MKKKVEKINAELFDKMQFCFNKYYDRIVHSYFVYEGKPNIEKMKSIILSFYKQIDILHCKYHNGFFKSYWIKCNYSLNEIFSSVNTNNLYEDIIKYLTTSKIESYDNVQFKMQVIIDEKENKFALCFIANHMILDGGDFKYLITNFIKAYNLNEEVKLKNESRNISSVYQNMDSLQKKIALNLYKNITSRSKKYQFNFAKNTKEDKCDLAILKFTKEESKQIVSFSKENKYSITDIFLTGYGVSSLSYLKNTKNYKYPFSMQSMVDLRRYIENSEKLGIANFTGVMELSFNPKNKDLISNLKDIYHHSIKAKQNDFLGLNALPLLSLDYKLFPNKVANLAFKLFFTYANFGLSNIGALDTINFQLNDATILDAHISGACQKKGKVMLSITSLDNIFTMSIPYIGNNKDKERFNSFLNKIKENILTLTK